MTHDIRTGVVLLATALMFAACQPVAAPSQIETKSPEAIAASATDALQPDMATPRPTRPPRVTLSGERRTFISQALAGNLLGDPVERGVYVILPSDYATSGKRYPVVFGLHGYGGNEYTDPIGLQRVQESALRYGRVKEMIFVFPDASNSLRGSMYLSSPTIGDYETYLTKELIDFIDTNYRTIPSPESRGIMGCSMGADGAIHLALKYPNVYKVVAQYSGTYDWTKDPWLAFGATGYDHEPVDLREFDALPLTETRWEIALAAAVTPNASKPPLFLDMPYVIVNGKVEIAPGFIEKLGATSPVQDAKNYANQPIRLSGILIYHGLNDHIAPVELARDFSSTLTDLGIAHEYLEVDAMHCHMDLEPILKFMSDNLIFDQE